LRERAARADGERKVPAESIAEMRDAGLLDVLLPRALGGSEVDFSVFSTITRLLATGCGSTAWVYAILTETAWIAALFPQKAQEEVWEDRSALFCASVVPYGKARKVEGGYRLTGRWQYLSGSDYATWVVLHANVDGESLIGTLVRRSELNMIDDWQVLGKPAPPPTCLFRPGERFPGPPCSRGPRQAARSTRNICSVACRAILSRRSRSTR
jgi:3-hydroxy-9,10-secoandrosta-1,3,5(10)-triene-9,17-dione monooxygenase